MKQQLEKINTRSASIPMSKPYTSLFFATELPHGIVKRHLDSIVDDLMIECQTLAKRCQQEGEKKNSPKKWKTETKIL